jgi:two-component system sensor histidine kinase/response regulator
MNKSVNMLLIDDEDKLLFGMKAIMQREGYTVSIARNGEEGLRQARELLPDIIICDVMMPPPNGFMLKKTLMQEERTAEIPFIFLTARTVDADKVAGLNMGADDYITKPFMVDELLARVQAVLRRTEVARKQSQREATTALEQLRTNIATNLGHEMRTPLGIILNTLDLAVRERFEGSAEEMDWYLQTAQSSAYRLQALVNDLIILNSIDQHNVSHLRQKIDMRFDYIDPIQKILLQWEQKHLKTKFIIAPGIELYATMPEFSHAVCHLVDNACKFSPDEGVIEVEMAKNGVGGCIVTVSDEGPGIPENQREKVFDRYYQISQGSNRLYGGLGVGLTIAREVAEALGGSVAIINTTTGCKVCLTLPPGENEWDSHKSSHQNQSIAIKKQGWSV